MLTYPNYEKVHEAVVDLSLLEHSLGTDCSPDDGCIVHHLGAVAGEAIRILGVTEPGYMAKHPT